MIGNVCKIIFDSEFNSIHWPSFKPWCISEALMLSLEMHKYVQWLFVIVFVCSNIIYRNMLYVS